MKQLTMKTMIVIFGLACLTYTSMFLFRRIVMFPLINTANPILHADIVLPAEVYNNGMYLRVTANSTDVLGMVDTGATSNSLLCKPGEPPLNFISTSSRVDSPYGNYSTQEGYFESAMVSGSVFQNFPCTLYYTNEPMFGCDNAGKPMRFLLGNGFLSNYTVTIDYPQKRLVLHKSQFDIARIPLKAGDALVDVEFIDSDGSFIPCDILLPATIGGLPAKLALDTGYGKDGFIISDKIRQSLAGLPPDSPSDFQWSFDERNISTQTSEEVEWVIGQVKGRCKAYVTVPGTRTNHKFDSIDGLIGTNLLHDYRITIDYQRKKLLLERTANTATSRLMQKDTSNPRSQIIFPSLPKGFHWVQRSDGTWAQVQNE